MAAFYDLRVNPDSAYRSENPKPRGAHFRYLEELLKTNGGGDGWCVGGQMTVADIEMYELFDIYARIFPDIGDLYPKLGAHFKRVAQVQGIKEYLESPLLLEQVNGNGLG